MTEISTFSELVVDERAQGSSHKSFLRFDSGDSQNLRGSNLTPPQNTAHVPSCHISSCVHFDCASNYAVSLPFSPVHVRLMPNHPEGSKEKPAAGKKRGFTRLRSPQWKKPGLKACLHECLRVVRACSSKGIMSAIHTWACFLLWISFATLDKTPGRTQAPLCPQLICEKGINNQV